MLDQAYYAGDRRTEVPNAVDAALAELVGYFMGDGSLHAKGIRLCVADADLDVVERIRVLSKGLFALEPAVRQEQGYQEVTLQSVRLARWWKAAGFAKDLPGVDHSGKGWTPRVPTAIRETNDPTIFGPSCVVCSRQTEPSSAACPSVDRFGDVRRRIRALLSRSASPRRPGTPSAIGVARSIRCGSGA